MKTNLAPFSRITLLTGFLVIYHSSPLTAQGPLTPPGAPAPTMKTLDQVEPRIAVNATNTPGNVDSIYVISQPGSYYLTGNVAGAVGKNGIEIAAPGVTLDLMGFEVIGGAGALRGIVATAGNGGMNAIRNGTIRSWGQRGIDLSLANCNYNSLSDLRVLGCSHGGIQGNLAMNITNCTVSSNSDFGIQVQDLAVITGCTMQSNGGGFGITTGTGSVVAHCAARFNTGGISVGAGSTVTSTTAVNNSGKGIVAGDGCTIAECAAYSNQGDGFAAGKGCTVKHCTAYTNTAGGDGIEVGEGAAVLDCTAYSNSGYGILANNVSATVSGCTVYKNNQSGISIGAGVVTRCESTSNNFDGIRVISACRITENKCFSNGPAGFQGAGIHVIQNDCTIENNIVAYNDYGLDVDSFPSAITHNTARANVTNNYEVAGGNFLGTIINTTASMNAAPNNYGNLSF
jgi:hypothetical protein